MRRSVWDRVVAVVWLDARASTIPVVPYFGVWVRTAPGAIVVRQLRHELTGGSP